MEFSHALEHVLKFEGGLSEDPRDPGGITKYGISLRAYPELGADGIRNLTKDQASTIYWEDYWNATRCEELPQAFRLMVFDCAVNQGTGYAARALQASIGARIDGAIGPKTIQAAKNSLYHSALQKLALNRFLRYQRNPNWDIYGEGWMSRLLSVSLLTFQN